MSGLDTVSTNPASDGQAGPRVMLYSQDGLGLGHMRRTSSIAGELLRICPGASVLTVADSPLGRFFDTKPNHDYIKLPSIVKLGPGDWQPVSLAIDFDEVLMVRRELLRSAVLGYKPDVLLVDHMAHGAMGELVPALDALKATGAHTKVVLGLRDILDAPEVIRSRWAIEGAYEVIERYYDLVLVYGSRKLFDLGRRYRLPASVKDKLHYCGYICAPDKARYTRRIRTEYTAGVNAGSRLIVGMAGGGADGYPLIRALIDAAPILQVNGAFVLVLIVGPFMPVDLRQDLQARAVGLPVRVRIAVSDPFSYMSAADVVVAMAGYNTTMEILRSRTPALLVPRAGPSAEQRMRTSLFRSRGWVDSLDPSDLDGASMAEAILSRLRRGPDESNDAPIDLGGLTSAVERLMSLLPPVGSRAL